MLAYKVFLSISTYNLLEAMIVTGLSFPPPSAVFCNSHAFTSLVTDSCRLTRHTGACSTSHDMP